MSSTMFKELKRLGAGRMNPRATQSAAADPQLMALAGQILGQLPRKERFDYMAMEGWDLVCEAARDDAVQAQVPPFLRTLSGEACRAWLILFVWGQLRPEKAGELAPTYREGRELAVAYTSDPAARLGRGFGRKMVIAIEHCLLRLKDRMQAVDKMIPDPLRGARSRMNGELDLAAACRLLDQHHDAPVVVAVHVQQHINIASNLAANCIHTSGAISLGAEISDGELFLALRSPDGFLSYTPGQFTGHLSAADIRGMRAFVSSYQGPALQGRIFFPQSRRLCELIGLRVESRGSDIVGFLDQIGPA